MKLLEILLERPGEVVTREELRSRIWANESFGDFDQAVNIAIAKLRSALGDSAENPRYIETLPKRGYRFIADVSVVDADVLHKKAGICGWRSRRRQRLRIQHPRGPDAAAPQPARPGWRPGLAVASVIVLFALVLVC